MQLIKFANGLRLLLIPRRSNLIYLEFQVLAGNFLSKPIETAHLLEHMAGHFTSRQHPDAAKINEMIESYGVDTNAHVGGYVARYHMCGQSEYAKELADVLIDLYRSFVIDPSIYKQERKAVCEELESLATAPWADLTQKTLAKLFPDHPISTPIAKRIQSSKKIKPIELMQFWNRYYKPNTSLFIAIGDCTLEEMLAMFKPLQKLSGKADPEWPRAVQPLRGPAVLFVRENSTSARVQMSFRTGIGKWDRRCYALDLICKILSQGVSSLLMQRLRSELGLVYNLECNLQADPEPSLSVIEVLTYVKQDQLKRLLKEIEQILYGFSPSTQQWEKAKKMAITELYQSSQSLASQARLFSQGLLWDQPLETLAQRKANYNRVSLDQAIKLARKVFTENNLLISYSCSKKQL